MLTSKNSTAMSDYSLETIKQKYNSVVQSRAKLADTQNMFGELGRGSGKTTEILAPRFVRVCYDLQRSIVAIAGPTYTFVLETIVPGILSFLNRYYERGKHFEYGKPPPNFFKRPYREVTNWKHTISFPWGTVAKFAGIDRPETSLIGQDVAHVFVDELLRINETNFSERLIPAKRGDRTIHKHSPYFGGITGFSSTPNFENDHDWWLKFEDNMDKGLIKEIMYVAYRVDVAQAKVFLLQKEMQELRAHNDLAHVQAKEKEIEKLQSFVNRWNEKLRQKRMHQTYYMKGSSFTNLAILGLDYMKEQFEGIKNFEKFKLSILGIRPNMVKNRFFAKFSKEHIFSDSYTYKQMDMFAADGTYKKTSKDLKHCDPKRPLLAGYDPGNFQSIVFAQEFPEKRTRRLRTFKNFYAYIPEEHFELAQKIHSFFAPHPRKTIYLHYDRAGNQRKSKYQDNPKGKTDATILKKHLEDLGWTVHLMSRDQRTIFYWQHHLLYSRLLSEREDNVPRLGVCENECEELVSSINMSPVKKTDNQIIELDKSSERKLDYEEQAFWSTQIASAWMYLVFGLYEKYLPKGSADTGDYQGL